MRSVAVLAAPRTGPQHEAGTFKVERSGPDQLRPENLKLNVFAPANHRQERSTLDAPASGSLIPTYISGWVSLRTPTARRSTVSLSPPKCKKSPRPDFKLSNISKSHPNGRGQWKTSLVEHESCTANSKAPRTSLGGSGRPRFSRGSLRACKEPPAILPVHLQTRINEIQPWRLQN
jgi:hypothetical protein